MSTFRQESQTRTGVSHPLMATGFLPREQSSQTPWPHCRHWNMKYKKSLIVVYIQDIFHVWWIGCQRISYRYSLMKDNQNCLANKNFMRWKKRLTWCSFAFGVEPIVVDEEEVEDELDDRAPSKVIWHTQHCKHSYKE